MTWGKLGRPQVIEKDKGTDKTARRRGEHPPNGEATDITRSGVDDGCDLGRAAGVNKQDQRWAIHSCSIASSLQT